MYAGRTPPAEPPCLTCRVDPFDDNRDALKIFFIVRYQLVMSMNGPIDLNHLAIDAAMRREGIESKACFDKVLTLGRWWMERIGQKDG